MRGAVFFLLAAISAPAPASALAQDQPTATGGDMVLEMPWKLDSDRLQPIAYRYRTGL